MLFFPGGTRRLCLVSALVLLLAGCSADRAWRAAQSEDTGQAYARFLRDHPDSKHRALAQERLEYQKMRREPSLAAYTSFESRYPDSERLTALLSSLEPAYFDRARAIGTPGAYETFLAKFPTGDLRARAEGNRAYLEASGFGSSAVDLAVFAEQHPRSDFAPEARRSAELASLLGEMRFQELRLVIEIEPDVGEADLLRARFARLARLAYARAGLLLEVEDRLSAGSLEAKPGAVTLLIHHQEFETTTRVENGQVDRAGMTALTTVSLRARGVETPVFTREFRLRVDPSQHIQGSSVLSSSTSGRYWDEFFVPIVRSPTHSRVRALHALEAGRVVDVDATFDRAVILFRDGRVQLIEFSDPDRPVWLARHSRQRDLKQWSGVKIRSGQILIFGEEGIEFLPAGDGLTHSMEFGRDRIGSVGALVEVDEGLVLAGPAGLRLLDTTTGQSEALLDRPVLGLTARKENLIFSDGESLFVSTVPLLRDKRVQSQIRVGRDFGLHSLRTLDRGALAIGEGGVVFLDIPDQGEPAVVARLFREEVGVVHDAVEIKGRLFLVGERGLQLVDSQNHRVVDSADVEAMSRLAIMGRHLIATGPHHIQAIDLSAWVPPRPGPPASAE